MAYCPQCLTEYAQGSPECIDCHVPLNSGAPPAGEAVSDDLNDWKNAELVSARIFRGRTASLDAELAKSILDSQGIPCALPG